jgi:four helix bundle protein
VSGPEISSYRDLRVWQDAMSLAEACYRVTRSFPKDETFGLSAQIRRAAASVPANVAEGHGREHRGSFIQHLRIAQGSLKELVTHLLLAVRVGVMADAEMASMMGSCETVGKMLRSLIHSLQNKGAG